MEKKTTEAVEAIDPRSAMPVDISLKDLFGLILDDLMRIEIEVKELVQPFPGAQHSRASDISDKHS